jgi:hypothetical protein
MANKKVAPGVRTFGNKYQAYASVSRKFVSIGYYDTIPEAGKARELFLLEKGITGTLGRPKGSKTRKNKI